MIREKVEIGGIYLHYKGNFYKVQTLAWNCNDQDMSKAIVVYNKCEVNGLYKRIGNEKTEFYVNQPFYRSLNEFQENIIVNNDGVETLVPRFKLVEKRN